MRRNLAAFTAFTSPYPPYISINEDNGDVEITVRSPPSGELCGATSSIMLTALQYEALLKEMTNVRH